MRSEISLCRLCQTTPFRSFTISQMLDTAFRWTLTCSVTLYLTYPLHYIRTMPYMPYKPYMKLSQAMRIMNNFEQTGHIDPNLFDVFVRKGVYRQYGEQFLKPEQLDEIDLKI